MSADQITPETISLDALAVDPGEALAEAHAVFTRWLGDDYDLDALDVVLATAAVEQLSGDPVWLLVISGPGNAKTETVSALAGIGAHVTSTLTGEAALLSGTRGKEKANDAHGGLLRKIGERGVLVIKDVTSILSMNRDRRAETLGALREVYDGRWERNIGTDGGRTLTWTGRIVLVGATTTAYDSAHGVISALGDRFALVRLDSATSAVRLGSGRQALANIGHEEPMRAELADAVAAVLAVVVETPLADDMAEALLDAANLVTLARTAVERDYQGNPEWAHAPEAPTRFAKMLGQIVRGAQAIGIPPERALALAIRVARDSMPPIRLAVLEAVRVNPGQPVAEHVRALQKPRSTVDRCLQELHLLGLVVVSTAEGETRWRYTLAEWVNLDHLDAQKITSFVHPLTKDYLEVETVTRSVDPLHKGGLDKTGENLARADELPDDPAELGKALFAQHGSGTP